MGGATTRTSSFLMMMLVLLSTLSLSSKAFSIQHDYVSFNTRRTSLFCSQDAITTSTTTTTTSSKEQEQEDSNETDNEPSLPLLLIPPSEEPTSVEEATEILSEFDRFYNPDTMTKPLGYNLQTKLPLVRKAVLILNQEAQQQRNNPQDYYHTQQSPPPQQQQETNDDTNNSITLKVVSGLKNKNNTGNDNNPTTTNQDMTTNNAPPLRLPVGQSMLGICAPNAAEGISTLKSFVSTLQLPRGLLHGMDRDGVPLEINGAVYIKYNSGGATTFGALKQLGLGFDALWRPGDALLEPYDGTYRGVYYSVTLADGVFRQFMVPCDLFL